MCAATSAQCLTRVIVDDDDNLELAQMDLARQRIDASLAAFPLEHRAALANALLYLALRTLRARECRQRLIADTWR